LLRSSSLYDIRSIDSLGCICAKLCMLALLVLASLDRVDWQSFDCVVSRLEVYQVCAIPGHLLNEEKSTCIVEQYTFDPL
jgi:hypothetical protein